METTCLKQLAFGARGAGPCGCFAVRASRSPNLIASRQAHLLARAHFPFLERFPVGGQDITVFHIVEIPLDGGELRIEVDDDSAWYLEQPHIVEKLGPMRGCHSRRCFAFDNDIALAQKIDAVFRIHRAPLVNRVEGLLPFERYASVGQFHRKRFLVAVFVNARSEFVVNGMQCAHNVIDVISQFCYTFYGVIISKSNGVAALKRNEKCNM